MNWLGLSLLLYVVAKRLLDAGAVLQWSMHRLGDLWLMVAKPF